MCVISTPSRRLLARAHREAVVLRRDLDHAGTQVLDRVVGAAVAELELVGVQAERQSEELVAEADAEDGHLAQQARDGLDGVGHGGRVAGAVAEEDAVGRQAQHLARAGGRRAPR